MRLLGRRTRNTFYSDPTAVTIAGMLPWFSFLRATHRGDSAASGDDCLTARFANDRSSLPEARKTARDFADRLGVHEERLEQLMCAVGEALANALDHGSQDGSDLWVRAWREPGSVVIEIEDYGPGFDPAGIVAPVAGAEHGYGIAIMREMADAVDFSADGRRVRLRKSVA